MNNIHPVFANTINAAIDMAAPGLFAVFSIVTNERLSEPKKLSGALDDLDVVGYAGVGGACNGIEVRRISSD